MSKLFFSDPEAHNSSSCSGLYWLQLDRHSPTFYLNSLLFSIRSSSVPINWPVKLKQVSIEELFALKLRRIFIKSIHFQVLMKNCSLSAKTTVIAHCYRLQLSRNDVMSLLREWCDSSRIPPFFFLSIPWKMKLTIGLSWSHMPMQKQSNLSFLFDTVHWLACQLPNNLYTDVRDDDNMMGAVWR